MKKTKTLFVMALSALMLASCGGETDSLSKEDETPSSSDVDQSSKEDATSSETEASKESGKQSSGSESSSSKELTAEEIWKNAFDNDKMENYTLSVNAGEIAFVQKRILGENGYSYWRISSGDRYVRLYGKKDDSLVGYSENDDGTWSTDEISLSELSELSRKNMLSTLSYEVLCPNFGDYFSKFALSSDGTYVFEGKDGEDEIATNGLMAMGDTSMNVYKAIVSFEGNHLKDVTYWQSGKDDASMTSKFTDWGTTTIDLPTNIHTHTFEKEWSSDQYGHYHKATCGHNVSADRAEHTYDNGVSTESGTKYTCTVCSYSYTKK